MIADTNIILHLLNPRHEHSAEVTRTFARLHAQTRVNVNEIVFAEISASFEAALSVSKQFEALGITIVRLTLEECFRAGQAFRIYRRNGGPRTSLLPDFLIGAQASVRGWPILTRDTARFKSYFPEVELIDPLKVEHD